MRIKECPLSHLNLYIYMGAGASTNGVESVAKANGDEAFRNRDYLGAIVHYTEVIEAASQCKEKFDLFESAVVFRLGGRVCHSSCSSHASLVAAIVLPLFISVVNMKMPWLMVPLPWSCCQSGPKDTSACPG